MKKHSLSMLLATALAACNSPQPVGVHVESGTSGETEEFPEDPNYPDPSCTEHRNSESQLGLTNGRKVSDPIFRVGSHEYQGNVIQTRNGSHQIRQYEFALTQEDVAFLSEHDIHVQRSRGNHGYDLLFGPHAQDIELPQNPLLKALNYAPADKISKAFAVTPRVDEQLPWKDDFSTAFYVSFHDDVVLTDAFAEVKGFDVELFAPLGPNGKSIPGFNTYKVVVPNDSAIDVMDALSHADSVRAIEPGTIPLTHTNYVGLRVTNTDVLQSKFSFLDGSTVEWGVYDAGRMDEVPDVEGRLIAWDGEQLTHYHATHVGGTTAGNSSGFKDHYDKVCVEWESPSFECKYIEQGATDEEKLLRSETAARGVGPNATILTSSHGGCDEYCLYEEPNDMAEIYTWMSDEGAIFITNSIGSNTAYNGFPCELNGIPTDTTGRLIDAFTNGMMVSDDGKDGLPVSVHYANGNERGAGRCQNEDVYGEVGEGYDTTGVPATTSKNAIKVGASTIHPGRIFVDDDGFETIDFNVLTIQDQLPSDYTSFGPTDDGRTAPTVMTFGGAGGDDPGPAVLSPAGLNFDGTAKYSSLSGTSMATPLEAGVTGVIIEHAQMLGVDEIVHTPSLVKALLINSTAYGYTERYQEPNNEMGYGFVDAYEMDNQLLAGNFRVDEIADGEVHAYQVTVGEDGARISLVWDDLPSAENAEIALVNDLDLYANGPSAHDVMLPTVPRADKPWCPSEQKRDSRNVEEQIIVPAGKYAEGTTLFVMVGGVEVNPQVTSYATKFTQTYSIASSAPLERIENSNASLDAMVR